MLPILRICFLLLLISLAAKGAVIQTNSTLLAVSNAVRIAAVGDVISLTNHVSGSFAVWDGPLTIAKPITLTNGESGKILVVLSNATIYVQGTNSAAKPPSLHGFMFTEAGSGVNQLVYLLGNGTNCFWLDDIIFTNTTSWCGWVASAVSDGGGIGPYGLISRIKVLSPTSQRAGFYVRENKDSQSWIRDMTWGSVSNVVFEDCVFSAASNGSAGVPAIDGDQGRRIIARHCYFTNYSFVCHGPDSPGPTNSALQTELYKNVFYTDDTYDVFVAIRGGVLRWYSNETYIAVGKTLNQNVHLTSYCSDGGACVVCVACKTSYPADYPVSQQPGRGVVSGAEATVLTYSWQNTVVDGGSDDAQGIAASPSTFVAAGREYTNAVPSDFAQLIYPHPLRGEATSESPSSSRGPRIRGIRLRP